MGHQVAVERSVIVPVFNGMKFLPEFWARLVANLPPDSELIIVDDGSLEPVSATFPKSTEKLDVKSLRNPINLGYAKTVNRGVGAASAQYLHVVNTDVFLDADVFQITEAALSADADLGVVGAKLVYPTKRRIQHTGMAFAHRRKHHFYRYCPEALVPTIDLGNLQAVTFALATIPVRVWCELGGLDEAFYNRNEDIDFCLRAGKAGYRIAVADSAMAYHWESVSGPARFALDAENEAEFWGRWKSGIEVDVLKYLSPALEFALARVPNERVVDREFLVANLARGDEIDGLSDVLDSQLSVSTERIEKRRRFTNQEKIHLPMEMAFGAASHPTAYIYIVDEWPALDENQLWFDQRAQIDLNDLIIDMNANVLWSSELTS